MCTVIWMYQIHGACLYNNVRCLYNMLTKIWYKIYIVLDQNMYTIYTLPSMSTPCDSLLYFTVVFILMYYIICTILYLCVPNALYQRYNHNITILHVYLNIYPVQPIQCSDSLNILNIINVLNICNTYDIFNIHTIFS